MKLKKKLKVKKLICFKHLLRCKYLIFTFLFFGCNKSNEEKAKEAIFSYLNENLDDMTTYEPVKYGNLVSFPDSLLNHPDFINSKPRFKMFHSYRIMGKKGHRILLKMIFVFDKEYNILMEFNKNYWVDYYSQPDVQD